MLLRDDFEIIQNINNSEIKESEGKHMSESEKTVGAIVGAGQNLKGITTPHTNNNEVRSQLLEIFKEERKFLAFLEDLSELLQKPEILSLLPEDTDAFIFSFNADLESLIKKQRLQVESIAECVKIGFNRDEWIDCIKKQNEDADLREEVIQFNVKLLSLQNIFAKVESKKIEVAIDKKALDDMAHHCGFCCEATVNFFRARVNVGQHEDSIRSIESEILDLEPEIEGPRGKEDETAQLKENKNKIEELKKKKSYYEGCLKKAQDVMAENKAAAVEKLNELKIYFGEDPGHMDSSYSAFEKKRDISQSVPDLTRRSELAQLGAQYITRKALILENCVGIFLGNSKEDEIAGFTISKILTDVKNDASRFNDLVKERDLRMKERDLRKENKTRVLVRASSIVSALQSLVPNPSQVLDDSLEVGDIYCEPSKETVVLDIDSKVLHTPKYKLQFKELAKETAKLVALLKSLDGMLKSEKFDAITEEESKNFIIFLRATIRSCLQDLEGVSDIEGINAFMKKEENSFSEGHFDQLNAFYGSSDFASQHANKIFKLSKQLVILEALLRPKKEKLTQEFMGNLEELRRFIRPNPYQSLTNAMRSIQGAKNQNDSALSGVAINLSNASSQLSADKYSEALKLFLDAIKSQGDNFFTDNADIFGGATRSEKLKVFFSSEIKVDSIQRGIIQNTLGPILNHALERDSDADMFLEAMDAISAVQETSEGLTALKGCIPPNPYKPLADILVQIKTETKAASEGTILKLSQLIGEEAKAYFESLPLFLDAIKKKGDNFFTDNADIFGGAERAEKLKVFFSSEIEVDSIQRGIIQNTLGPILNHALERDSDADMFLETISAINAMGATARAYLCNEQLELQAFQYFSRVIGVMSEVQKDNSIVKQMQERLSLYNEFKKDNELELDTLKNMYRSPAVSDNSLQALFRGKGIFKKDPLNQYIRQKQKENKKVVAAVNFLKIVSDFSRKAEPYKVGVGEGDANRIKSINKNIKRKDVISKILEFKFPGDRKSGGFSSEMDRLNRLTKLELLREMTLLAEEALICIIPTLEDFSKTQAFVGIAGQHPDNELSCILARKKQAEVPKIENAKKGEPKKEEIEKEEREKEEREEGKLYFKFIESEVEVSFIENGGIVQVKFPIEHISAYRLAELGVRAAEAMSASNPRREEILRSAKEIFSLTSESDPAHKGVVQQAENIIASAKERAKAKGLKKEEEPKKEELEKEGTKTVDATILESSRRHPENKADGIKKENVTEVLDLRKALDSIKGFCEEKTGSKEGPKTNQTELGNVLDICNQIADNAYIPKGLKESYILAVNAALSVMNNASASQDARDKALNDYSSQVTKLTKLCDSDRFWAGAQKSIALTTGIAGVSTTVILGLATAAVVAGVLTGPIGILVAGTAIGAIFLAYSALSYSYSRRNEEKVKSLSGNTQDPSGSNNKKGLIGKVHGRTAFFESIRTGIKSGIGESQSSAPSNGK